MSLEKSEICKPFIKPTKELHLVVPILLIIRGISICMMICFDLIFIKLHQRGNVKTKAPLSLFLFVGLIASAILFLSSESFNKKLFCAMNINEKICKTQRNYKHAGSMHTFEDPLYVSAPCEASPEDYVFTYLGNSDILNLTDKISPCTIELRSNFFIEHFQMSDSVSPNDFVLINREPLYFVSDMDFHSWSKPGSSIFDP